MAHHQHQQQPHPLAVVGKHAGSNSLSRCRDEALKACFVPCAECFARHPNIMDCLDFKYGEGVEYEIEEVSKLCSSCRNRVVVFPPSVVKKFKEKIDPITGEPRSAAKQLAHLREKSCISMEQLVQFVGYLEDGSLTTDVWVELSEDDQVKFINTKFPSSNRV